MATASLGALIAMTGIALLTWHYKRDFAREFDESLTIRRSAPLGEDEMARIQLDGNDD
jgi:putative membrane protein